MSSQHPASVTSTDSYVVASPSAVNPMSGLASDYLNQFYEVLLMLEHLDDDPTLITDLAQWVPQSYFDHCDNSGLPERNTMIAAYQHALPVIRRRFDELASETATSASIGVDALLRLSGMGSPIGSAARVLADELRGTVLRLDALIHCRSL